VIVAVAAACGAPPRAAPASAPARAVVVRPAPRPVEVPPQPRPGPTAVELEGGVVIETVEPGDGPPPVQNDFVRLLWFESGPDDPKAAVRDAQGEVHQLSAEVATAVKHMRPGERARLWIPTVDGGGRATAPLFLQLELMSVEVAPPVPADVGVAPKTATVTPSGTAHVVLVPGTGTTRPGPLDGVVIRYAGWDPTGLMVESTREYQPGLSTSMNTMSPGFAEALATMSVGQTSRFWVPGGGASGPSDLEVITYDVTLLAIHVRLPPPPTPKDVAKPPRGAKRTKAGVSYRFLARAKQRGARPTATSRVRVHYTGWNTNGQMFDSSVTRGSPADFPLEGVIAGWTDVLQVMTPGDRIRAWIPEDLAYQGRPGPPQGMLVFDIELIEILP
jgi:peptidylprolyl isomerase